MAVTQLPATSREHLREALRAHYLHALWHRTRQALVHMLAVLGGLLWMQCAIPGCFAEGSARLLLWTWPAALCLVVGAGANEWWWARKLLSVAHRDGDAR